MPIGGVTPARGVADSALADQIAAAVVNPINAHSEPLG